MKHKFTFSHGLLIAVIFISPLANSFARAEISTEGLSPSTVDILNDFKSSIADEALKLKTGSITAGVIVGGELALSESFGCADCENNIAATPDNIYRIGSISKTMTSTVLALLVEDGTVSLDDPVSKYVPEFAELIDPQGYMSDITLRHLANHTSGLAREPGLEGAASGPIGLWKEKILSSIPTTAIRTKPGTNYSYSNIGYGILGLAMERATGVPFMELLNSKLFEPLEMTTSTFILSATQLEDMTKGYQQIRDSEEFDAAGPASDHDGRGYKVPNGGVYTTLSDLSKYLNALSGQSDVYSNEVNSLIYSYPQGVPTSADNELNVYGLGINIDLSENGVILNAGHGGSVAGYTAWMRFDLNTGHGIILLRSYNKRGGNLDIAISKNTLEKLIKTSN